MKQAVLVFDGRCGFCMRVVEWLLSLDTNHVLEAVAWQEHGTLLRTGLTREEVRDAAWLLVDGKRHRGAAAINFALTLVSKNPWPWHLYSLPFFGWVEDCGYAWVSRNRRLFRGAVPKCKRTNVMCSDA